MLLLLIISVGLALAGAGYYLSKPGKNIDKATNLSTPPVSASVSPTPTSNIFQPPWQDGVEVSLVVSSGCLNNGPTKICVVGLKDNQGRWYSYSFARGVENVYIGKNVTIKAIYRQKMSPQGPERLETVGHLEIISVENAPSPSP